MKARRPWAVIALMEHSTSSSFRTDGGVCYRVKKIRIFTVSYANLQA